MNLLYEQSNIERIYSFSLFNSFNQSKDIKNYLILGKDEIKGIVGDDSKKNEDIKKYFELGWEVVGSRLDFISLYNMGIIDEEKTTVVTTEDRMFFYTGFYKNVISYSDFKKLNVSKDKILCDFPEEYMGILFHNHNKFLKPKTMKYYREEQDRDLIFNGFDLKNTISPNEDFVVMAIRQRDWCKERNSNITFFQELVNEIKKHFPIYVAGKGNEDFCNTNGLHYVSRLKDYVSLIKNKKCKSLVTQSTGLALLAFASSETDIQFIDHIGCSELNSRHAISGGIPVQFLQKSIFPYYHYNSSTLNAILKGVLNG